VSAKTIPERLRIFFGRLSEAAAAASDDQALELLISTMNEVEDEFSGLPYDPASWREKRRLYPPSTDFERKLPGWPQVRMFRQTQHVTYIGRNGSIEIQFAKPSPRAGEVVFSKPGEDGKEVWEQ